MSRKSKAQEFTQEGYNITLTGRHVQVTDSMKDYALEKLSKIEKFSTRIIDAVITMDIQKLEHRVDIMLKVDHIIIKAHASTDNMYASIDKAVDRLETQLRRYKRKIRDHQAKPLEVIDMKVNVFRAPEDADLLDINLDIEEENARKHYHRPQIVNQETIPLKTLSHDEAIMKMDLSGDRFMLFRSEEDRKLKLIYLRNDGNFGIIEPEA